MAQITKRGEVLYYGEQACRDANEAYCRFRDDYHTSLGKRVFRRLNMPNREERIHGFKCFFSLGFQFALDSEFGEPNTRIPYRLLGIVGISYARCFDGNFFPDYEDEKFARWLDWFLLHAGEIMYQIGKNDKSGRTSKRLKTRYR